MDLIEGNYCHIFNTGVLLTLSVQKLNCQWQKTGQFVLQSMVRNLAWHPTGTWMHISLLMLRRLLLCVELVIKPCATFLFS